MTAHRYVFLQEMVKLNKHFQAVEVACVTHLTSPLLFVRLFFSLTGLTLFPLKEVEVKTFFESSLIIFDEYIVEQWRLYVLCWISVMSINKDFCKGHFTPGAENTLLPVCYRVSDCSHVSQCRSIMSLTNYLLSNLSILIDILTASCQLHTTNYPNYIKQPGLKISKGICVIRLCSEKLWAQLSGYIYVYLSAFWPVLLFIPLQEKAATLCGVVHWWTREKSYSQSVYDPPHAHTYLSNCE